MKEVTQHTGQQITHTYGKRKNPFPGLRPFKIDESHLFFGREGQSDEVLLKLSQNRFVGIIGPSGSGKSSFIYCGVLPILYGGFLTGTGSEWEVIVTRPGAGPIDNLGLSLLKTDPDYQNGTDEDRQIKETIVSSLLRSSSMGLVESILQLKKDSNKNFLILVDQFEELFRFKDQSDSRSVNETLAFINLLMEAINYTGAPIYVAITMRSDFIGECAQFPELTKQINDSQYLIPQMTRDQKRRAITGPVAVGGGTIAPRLVQQLLNDLGDNPDQLPILQHALMRTWDYWAHFKDYEEEPLDIKHYEAIGTMAEALSMHANEAYDELSSQEQRICESLFKAITEKRGGSYGIRRPTKLGEIAQIADTSEEKLIGIIEKFRHPERSLLTPQYGIKLEGSSIIDISHESIMRIWNRLKNWVNDEADAVQMYKRLAEAADMFQQGKTSLWRPPDLQLALNWRSKHNPTLIWGQRYHPAFERTMSFLNHSEEEFELEQRAKELQQKRRLRFAKVTAIILAAATVISMAGVVYAFFQQTRAQQSAEQAEYEKILADSARNRASESEKEALINLEIADREREAADSAKRVADEQRMRAVDALDLAEKRRIAAERAEGKASESAEKARQEEARAREEQRIAEEATARANRLRYTAISNSMAIKSTQINNPQLQGLLAQQAYDFDEEYNSYQYDPEVYDGLYYALKTFDDPITKPHVGHSKAARVIEPGASGSSFYSAGSDGKILHWYTEKNSWKSDTIRNQRGTVVVKTMYFDAKQNQLYVAGTYPVSESGASSVERINLKTKEGTMLSGVEESVVKLLAYDETLLALDNGGRTLKKLENGKFIPVHQFNKKINDIAATELPNTIWAGSDAGELLQINLSSNTDSVFYRNKISISAVTSRYSMVAIGDEMGGVKLFTDNNFEAFNDLSGHESRINSIAIRDDASGMITASKDRTVRVWNLAEIIQQPIVLSDHNDWLWNAQFTKDGKYIVAVAQDGMVRTWPSNADMMDGKLCKYLERNLTMDEWAIYVAPDLEYEETCSNSKAISEK